MPNKGLRVPRGKRKHSNNHMDGPTHEASMIKRLEACPTKLLQLMLTHDDRGKPRVVRKWATVIRAILESRKDEET